MMPLKVESEIAISYQVAALGQPPSDKPWVTGRSDENISRRPSWAQAFRGGSRWENLVE